MFDFPTWEICSNRFKQFHKGHRKLQGAPFPGRCVQTRLRTRPKFHRILQGAHRPGIFARFRTLARFHQICQGAHRPGKRAQICLITLLQFHQILGALPALGNSLEQVLQHILKFIISSRARPGGLTSLGLAIIPKLHKIAQGAPLFFRIRLDKDTAPTDNGRRRATGVGRTADDGRRRTTNVMGTVGWPRQFFRKQMIWHTTE